MQSRGMTLGLVLVSAGMLGLGCGSSVSNGGSGGSGSTSTASSSSTSSGGEGGFSSTSGGTGGDNPSGTGGGGAGGGGTAGAGGTGGSAAYATCEECQAEQGAAQNECAAELQACMEWKTCVSYLNCNTFGIPNGPGPCNKTTTKGACCSVQCEETLADPEGIARYRALDMCINCKTCRDVCMNGPTYCAVFEPGGLTLCNP